MYAIKTYSGSSSRDPRILNLDAELSALCPRASLRSRHVFPCIVEKSYVHNIVIRLYMFPVLFPYVVHCSIL